MVQNSSLPKREEDLVRTQARTNQIRTEEKKTEIKHNPIITIKNKIKPNQTLTNNHKAKSQDWTDDLVTSEQPNKKEHMSDISTNLDVHRYTAISTRWANEQKSQQ